MQQIGAVRDLMMNILHDAGNEAAANLKSWHETSETVGARQTEMAALLQQTVAEKYAVKVHMERFHREAAAMKQVVRSSVA